MQVHEINRHLLNIGDHSTVKEVAKGLGLSPSTIYDWCRPWGVEFANTGEKSPLLKLDGICAHASRESIQVLVDHFNEILESRTPHPINATDTDIKKSVANLVKKFSEALTGLLEEQPAITQDKAFAALTQTLKETVALAKSKKKGRK